MPAPEETRRLTPNAPPTYPQSNSATTDGDVPRWRPATQNDNSSPPDQASQEDRISNRIGQQVQAYAASQQPVLSELGGQGVRRLAPASPPAETDPAKTLSERLGIRMQDYAAARQPDFRDLTGQGVRRTTPSGQTSTGSGSD